MPDTARTTPDLPDLLTSQEVADLARVSLDTVKRWTARGYLPTVRMSRRVFIRRDVLAAFLEASSTPATAGPLAGRRA